MPKQRSTKQPKSPASPTSARARFALLLVVAALLPVLYGIVADWHLFVTGRWDRPYVLQVIWSAVAAGALCVSAVTLPLLGSKDSTPDLEAEGKPAPNPILTRLLGICIVALFGTGVAFVLITAMPEALVSAYCNFGVGKNSAAAIDCRISYTHGPVMMFAVAGFALCGLAILLTYAGNKWFPQK